MKSLVWLFAGVAAVFAGRGSAAAADEPARVQAGPFVVIVGAGQFQDQAIEPRPTADTDAKALYDLLVDSKYLGVPAERMKLLLSTPDNQRPSQIATRAAIVKAIESATSRTGQDDLLIIAFFGQGATVGDKTIFLTPDASIKDRAKTALVFGDDLEAAFKKVKNQNVLMLMDMHYKGYKPGNETVAVPSLADVDALVFGSEEKEEASRPRDRLLLLSGFVSSNPLSRGESGLFASTVIEALKGAADTAPSKDGYESDGVVTIDELVKYLDAVIPEQARKIGKTDQEKESQAVPIGSRTSHFVVTRNPAETETVKKRLGALASLARNGTLSVELAKEGTALLSRMPKLLALQELRKNYQQLADATLKTEAFLTVRQAIKDGQKLDPQDAESYAKKVIAAMDIVTKVYIKRVSAGELTVAAIRGLYRRIEEPLPADLADSLQAPNEITEAKQTELLHNARLRLGKREDLEQNKDADISILMMMASLKDPYSVYYDKETVRKMASALRGRFPGVGVQIRRDAVHDAILVVSPIKGSPAFEAGIRAGDRIVEIRREVDSITGQPLSEDDKKIFSTKGMKTDDAITLITGKPGSPITLVVDRDGKEMTVPLKRNWVSIETVMGVKRNANADWDFLIDSKYGIGYIRLTQFTQSTTGHLREAIADLKAKGLKGLVIDLRGNPGGYLTAATSISEMFVGKEKVVSVRPREGSTAGRTRTYRGEKDGDKTIELVVLINGTSASASEIFAACLQDHARATIIGERSYGKGSVQDVLKFDETGGEIKLTIARYFPPSDRNIDKAATSGLPSDVWGVRPDKGYEVKLSLEESNKLQAHMRDIEVISPPGKAVPEVSEGSDKQLKSALTFLRILLDENGKGSDKSP